MCGIAGCTGMSDAGKFLLNALKRLEYRGYDSAGMTLTGDGFRTIKVAGKVADLEAKYLSDPYLSLTGIAHTRWATHGVPSENNAHPHLCCNGRISIVHNGILNNYLSLKDRLEKAGHHFLSETDSEVIPHLIESLYDGDPIRSVSQAVEQLSGSFAIAVIFKDHPDQIICARKGSPLVIGLCTGCTLAASDVLPIVPYTKKVIYLRDGELASLTPGRAQIFQIKSLKEVSAVIEDIGVDESSIQKGAYEHFMLKEIMEQPEAFLNVMEGRVDADGEHVVFSELLHYAREMTSFSRIIITGCGSSLHAGLIGKYFLEEIALIPVSVEQSSEFQCRNPIVEPGTLVIAISQSGETADTLAAVREAKAKRAFVLAVCNCENSSMARAADAVSYLHAGPEQSVASTKAYTCQVLFLLLFAISLGRSRHLSIDRERELVQTIKKLPLFCKEMLAAVPQIRELAGKYSYARDFFYIGRGYLYPTALEGALKLKEISYIHAEGYHAAELKHGPIALLDASTPVIALIGKGVGQEKTIGTIQECLARHAPVVALASETSGEKLSPGIDRIIIPECSPLLNSVITAVALQLFAYYFAKEKGCSIDQPRNLAKSVTVE